MNYRYYRLPTPRSYDPVAADAQVVQDPVGALEAPASEEIRRIGTDHVFDFLDRYREPCRATRGSEEEAFLLLTDCLEGRAKALYDSVSRSNRSETGIYSWCSAVNWVLRTFATDENVSRAVSRLNSARQAASEDEDAYFERFANLHTACENYLPEARLRSLFISGLDVRIADTVRAYLASNPAADMGQLLERARRQGTTVRHITAGIPRYSRRHAPLDGAPNKRSVSSVAFADEPVVGC